MQSFIRLFASFIPWSVLSWVMKTGLLVEYKVAVWLVLVLFMLGINFRLLTAGDPVAFSNIGAFIFIFINFFTLKIRFLMIHPAAVCYGVMATAVFLSVLLQRPFTINYVGVSVPEEKKRHPVFRQINYVISLVWGGVFIVNATVNYFYHYSVATRIFSLCVVISGILASGYITGAMRRYYRRKSAG